MRSTVLLCASLLACSAQAPSKLAREAELLRGSCPERSAGRTLAPPAPPMPSGVPACPAAPEAALQEIHLEPTVWRPADDALPSSTEKRWPFPALRADGKVLVAREIDGEGLSDRASDRVRFYAMPKGTLIAAYVLGNDDDESSAHDDETIERAKKAGDAALRAAQRQLDGKRWQPLEGGWVPDADSCAWASWPERSQQKLDAHELIRWFPAAELEVELLQETYGIRYMIVRDLNEREQRVMPVGVRSSATMRWEGRVVGCGQTIGLRAAWVLPDRSALVVLPDVMLPGDSCIRSVALDDLSIVPLTR